MSSSQPAFPFRLDFPTELPISARAEEITAAIQAHPVVILAGQTGSGKSTQIPKLCLAAGRGIAGRIACTQPRRVAALSVSRRVAEEMGVQWGREVGCKVRFSDETTAETRIKFVTDGMLLSEAQGDPLLREYDTIIVDEAHERSLNIDFLLGHLRQLRERRSDLKIIITSATIDTAVFSEAFGGAPVITVEGRTYPVEVIYAPLDSFGSDAEPGSEDAAEKAEALHYIDGAIEAVDRIVRDTSRGDILVFMPSERDVRETCDDLEGKLGNQVELVPLFGRLTNAEQQRVFAPSMRRKIVVATNIAETSLTIPGVHFVVDTGLARVSRYVPQARTRRLPIEEISQASADQRKGRCGRVANGVCIRLFSEEDFLARPRFTQPEIQRANLADVILRLKAFDFGEVEEFPFLSPPLPKAVRAGYGLLEELGALEADGRLSAVGRELARLPADPTVGRMILQARKEKALKEVLVIAAGLSVQDPRERPLERQKEADEAHRRFAHPDSDFLALLNIWEAYHGEFERMSQARLRRFCKEHFLSYTRMREWRDVHDQLEAVLSDRRDFQMSSVMDGRPRRDAEKKNPPLKSPAGAGRPPSPGAPRLDQVWDFAGPAYRAVHRSVLAGLLGNIATWDDANGGYKAAHDRRVALFPGSVLFRKAAADKRGGPRWIVASEIVETTRIYARTCARIDPAWALELAAHVVKLSHSEPFWDETSGRVKVKQTTRLYGLEIDRRGVSFGKINPAAATEIFLREGLVNDTITWPFDFLKHNRAERERLVERLTRARHSGFLNLDEALYRFYAARLSPQEIGPGGVSSVGELVEIVRERRARDPRFLQVSETDLIGAESPEVDEAAYPPSVPLQNRALPLHYAYRPGQDDDGVTLELTAEEARRLTEAALDWAVPGHLEGKVEHYLRALPKELRRTFVPLGENARILARALESRHRLTGGRETVAEALAAEIRERHKLGVTAAVWAGKPPPDHLRVRVKVKDVVASRDWAEIQAAVGIKEEAARPEEQAKGKGVSRFSRELEHELRYELGWLERDLKRMREWGPLTAAWAPIEALQADAFERLKSWVCDPARLGTADAPQPIGPAAEAAKAELRRETPRFLEAIKEVFELRQALMVNPASYPLFGNVIAREQGRPPNALQRDVERLVGPEFLRETPFRRVFDLPRYLKALQVRAERWRAQPQKDAERARRLEPYRKWLEPGPAGRDPAAVRWLVEEYRVSLFAQELGTSEPVSSVKLDRAIAAAEPKPASAAIRAAPPAAAPAVAKLEPGGEKKPLKSLSGLDKFFSH